MITDVDGVRVGHWTDRRARTGCTAVLFPAGTVASGEVRGGAPGTREWELLHPARLVQHVDAVVLSGGSAFGLAACDGVTRWCEERGIGFPTSAGPVPIVVGAIVFDLSVGDPSVRPGAEEGYAACVAASDAPFELGLAGAGTGCTVAKWRGKAGARDGGLGAATRRHESLIVSALVVVNATGDLRERVGDIAAELQRDPFESFENTTIGVIVTNARIDKLGCLLAAQAGHDGLARALEPVHARADGDALVVAATGTADASVDVVRILAAGAVEDAVRSVLA